MGKNNSVAGVSPAERQGFEGRAPIENKATTSLSEGSVAGVSPTERRGFGGRAPIENKATTSLSEGSVAGVSPAERRGFGGKASIENKVTTSLSEGSVAGVSPAERRGFGGRAPIENKAIWLLGIILVSYFVVGFPDGAYTVSWHGIAEDIAGMTTATVGWILVGYSVTYTLAGVILTWLNRFMKLQTAYFWGLVVMGLGFVGLALSQNFAMVLSTITIYGFGAGLMASSMNAYMAKHFTAKHNNWMHCFWGGGASLSPIIMGQMMAILSWRAGYFVIAGFVAFVGIILLISFTKKMWIDDSDEHLQIASDKEIVKKRYLTKKWHQVLEILTFFFLGGTDYTLVFFTGAALMARGTHTHEEIVIFSTVYYVSMTAGRMFFGWATKFLKEVPIERIGILISIVGLGIVYFTSNIFGMALLGFGLGPLLPTLVSDSSNRFTPNILSKIVGFELAAFGAGIAALFFLTSQLMHFVTYEALFPLALSFILLVFICNEVLAFALKREQNSL